MRNRWQAAPIVPPIPDIFIQHMNNLAEKGHLLDRVTRDPTFRIRDTVIVDEINVKDNELGGYDKANEPLVLKIHRRIRYD